MNPEQHASPAEDSRVASHDRQVQPASPRTPGGRASVLPLAVSGGTACGGPVGRRTFLKIAGAGVAAHALGRPIAVMAGPFERGANGEIRHFVPADKKLAPEWVRSLFDRGEPEVYRARDLETLGMPVGGIAAGQLYLLGDGTLGVWQIFNRLHFTGYGETNYQRRVPDAPVEQGFRVIVEQGEASLTRGLNHHDFPGVSFRGEYPIGRVDYREDGFPVAIELEAFSPFIPLNTKDSALPATMFHITVRNVSARPLRAALGARLENAVLPHSAADVRGRRRSRIVADGGRTFILHGAEEAAPEEIAEPRPEILLADFEGEDYGDWETTGTAFGDGPARGTLPDQNEVTGYRGEGLVNTFLGGDGAQGTLTSPPFTINRRYINFLVGGGNHVGQTCIDLIVDGEVVRSTTGQNEERLRPRSWRVREFEGKEARIRIVDEHSGHWGHINVDHIVLSDVRDDGPTGPLDKLEDYGTLALAYDGTGRAEWPTTPGGEAWSIEKKRVASMRTDGVELAAGAAHTFTFVLAWHFPNHEHGQQYANWFDDADGVARYVLDHHDRLAGDTRLWHRTYYDGTLPYWLLNRIGSTVANLATGTCQWRGNGRFWAWEGVGCCPGTCTHVWNYAHAMGRLFPELERIVREMQDLGVAMQGDGLIGFRGIADGHYAADGQVGTILKCYREHQMSADDAFLKRNWPKIRLALEYSIKQDGNDNGLIENFQHNTYDIDFFGPNTMVGSLYLAALLAAEQMATEVGDTDFARRVRRIYESGRKLTEERLWNGEYFIQIVDLEEHPKHQYGQGCLSDQLFGQGWAHQLGLGHIYREDYVNTALASVYKYNWAPDVAPHNRVHGPWRWFVSPGEAGLFNCTWPLSEHLPDGVVYQNEVWTGIEYQVAGNMIWEGMLTEGLALIRAIHDRYQPENNNPWNEVECGDHYARALASWGCLIALSGYAYHGPKGHLAFAPRITPERFRCVFTAAEGWGTFDQQRADGGQRDRITLRWGRLRLAELALGLPAEVDAPRVTVRHDDRPVEVEAKAVDGRLTITFAEPIVLEAGQSLDVVIA